jgi:hypothetical protein
MFHLQAIKSGKRALKKYFSIVISYAEGSPEKPQRQTISRMHPGRLFENESRSRKTKLFV